MTFDLVSSPPGNLKVLDQIADTDGVGFAMSVAGDGIGAAGGFNPNFRPHYACGNMHRRDLGHGDALVIAAEPARLYSAHADRADDKASGKKKISRRPAAGGEGFGVRFGPWDSRSYTHSSAPFGQTHM